MTTAATAAATTTTTTASSSSSTAKAIHSKNKNGKSKKAAAVAAASSTSAPVTAETAAASGAQQSTTITTTTTTKVHNDERAVASAAVAAPDTAASFPWRLTYSPQDWEYLTTALADAFTDLEIPLPSTNADEHGRRHKQRRGRGKNNNNNQHQTTQTADSETRNEKEEDESKDDDEIQGHHEDHEEDAPTTGKDEPGSASKTVKWTPETLSKLVKSPGQCWKVAKFLLSQRKCYPIKDLSQLNSWKSVAEQHQKQPEQPAIVEFPPWIPYKQQQVAPSSSPPLDGGEGKSTTKSGPFKPRKQENSVAWIDNADVRLEIVLYWATVLQQDRLMQSSSKQQNQQQHYQEEKQELQGSRTSAQPQHVDTKTTSPSNIKTQHLEADTAVKSSSSSSDDDIIFHQMIMKNIPADVSDSQRQMILAGARFLKADYDRRRQAMRQRMEILEYNFFDYQQPDKEQEGSEGTQEQHAPLQQHRMVWKAGQLQKSYIKDILQQQPIHYLDKLLEHFGKPHSASAYTNKFTQPTDDQPAPLVPSSETKASSDDQIINDDNVVNLDRGGRITDSESRVTMPEWSTVRVTRRDGGAGKAADGGHNKQQ